MELLTIQDYEREAERRLPRAAFDYYRSGADDQRTVARNVEALARLSLHYRTLVDVSERDAAARLLDDAVSMPIAVAPTAFHKLAHPEGELATARASRAANVLMVLSTLSNTPIEEVAAAHDRLWFQLYVYRDRGATDALVQRVRDAGAKALVLTVDAPLLGRREADVRNRFSLPQGLRIENVLGVGGGSLPDAPDGSGLAGYFARVLDPSLDFSDLEWLCSRAGIPVLVKGIVRPDDAQRALEHGAAGVIVSNHGGRQLDTAPATIEVLPAIADALQGRGLLMCDGGIRRGTDVIKAIACGATAVLLGRPILWGLSVSGEHGVRSVLELMRRELDLAMALTGCRSVEEITRDLVDL